MWFNSLEKFEQTYYRAKFRKACEVSPATVNNWIRGLQPIKRPFRVVINEVIGQNLL